MISYDKMSSVFRQSKINLNLSNSLSHDIRFILAVYPPLLFT